MGKKGKGKSGDLGRALLRDRFGKNRSKCGSGESSMLHTTEVNDGYQWDRLNLNSVTEESSFQEFLSTAQLAGTEFHAEKLNIKYVNPNSEIGLISNDERKALLEVHKSKQALLKIPRRPKWDGSTSRQELETKENLDFLEWRRQLSILQEVHGLTMTPYEKNLEFWRQLWRVVERSDVIVQIVDARNPLLFRCEDLEKYVKEIDETKMNMILINKADFLTAEQRKLWCEYFTEIGIRVAFFSATDAAESVKQSGILCNRLSKKLSQTLLEEESENDVAQNENEEDDGSVSDDVSELSHTSDYITESEYESTDDTLENISDRNNGVEIQSTLNDHDRGTEETSGLGENSPELLTRSSLIALFKSLKCSQKTFIPNVVTIGLVGYPNVGKSSTINAILADKKVSVSATPGKTKHFQTLFVDKELLLCDCPGLVMPSFICTKAEMILHGILPIDQLRDHVPSITLLGTLIPRHILEDTYGIMLPMPIDGEDPDRPPTSEEILNTYGYNRGFMTANGQPDNPRSARYLLKDFVNGKLLYCVAPPNKNQLEFHTFPSRRKKKLDIKDLPRATVRASRGVTVDIDEMDRKFLATQSSGVHVKGLPGTTKLDNTIDLGAKPWKKINKHKNKNKREKTRRIYGYLDRH